MASIEYQGYVASIEFDAAVERLVGRVMNASAPLEFQVDSASEALGQFREVVDAYLADCRERGVAPERPYSGRILLRIDPGLHGAVAAAAAASETSINGFVEQTLRDAVVHPR
jgi:predicted HicB family RNase H-like nuclease